jgi:IS30 family transposase
MEPYHQLTREQRYQIYALRKTGHSNVEIAEVIGVHKATIGRELQRNSGAKGYRPRQAHQRALRRRKRQTVRITAPMWQEVERLLRRDWSPEQIAGRLHREHNFRISPEWIYQHVLQDQRAGGDLHRHLRCQKVYHKRYGYYDRRGTLPPGRSIDERPAVVAQRRLGDWEADTMSGKGRLGGLLTLTERQSRFTRLAHLSRRSAALTERQVYRLLLPVRDRVQTLTSDHGREFLHHERMARRLDLTYYLAHPYCAWERGTNENTNGLVRQYFPKQRDLRTVTPQEVRQAERCLNLRPRKCLAFRTPFEVFFHQTVALTT